MYNQTGNDGLAADDRENANDAFDARPNALCSLFYFNFIYFICFLQFPRRISKTNLGGSRSLSPQKETALTHRQSGNHAVTRHTLPNISAVSHLKRSMA